MDTEASACRGIRSSSALAVRRIRSAGWGVHGVGACTESDETGGDRAGGICGEYRRGIVSVHGRRFLGHYRGDPGQQPSGIGGRRVVDMTGDVESDKGGDEDGY